MNKIVRIIKESIDKFLTETDIVPDNGIVKNNFMNQWRMIYNLLSNIKTSMDATYQDYDGRITKQHIDSIVEYINMCRI